MSWARCCCAADALGWDSPGASATPPEAIGVVVADPSVSVVEPVTLDEAKQHCRIDITDDDNLVELYLAAARVEVENHCERMFVAQGFIGQYHVVDGAAPITLGRWPVEAVTAVEQIHADGSPVTAIAGWSLDSTFGVLYPPAAGWPVGPDAVRVKFTGGPPAPEGSSSTPAPPPVRASVLWLTAQYYSNRAAVSLAGAPVAFPLQLEWALAPYRLSTGLVSAE